jgi:hypothetical protein
MLTSVALLLLPPLPLLCLPLQGLYLVDMSVPQPVAKMLDVGPMDPQTNFCEVKWCSATGRLMAATGMGAAFELLECRA